MPVAFVARVARDRQFQRGRRHLGHWLTAEVPNRIVVETNGGAVDLDAGSVVQSDSAVLPLIGGIQYSQEDVTTGVAGQDTFEGYAGLTWD